MSAPGVVPDLVPGSAAWWREHEARQARRRPRADGLTLERIVAGALAVVDDEGLDALTVRHLADHLQTGSASLYRHVASRDELLVLLVDHVIGEVRFPDPELPARTRVEQLSTELRRVLMDHAQLLPALTASPLLGPNATRGSEQGLANLLDAGFPPEAALPAYLALIDYVLGTVYFDSGRAAWDAADHDPGRVAKRLAGRFPSVAVGGRRLVLSSTDEIFRFGLTMFLDGLEHRFPPVRA